MRAPAFLSLLLPSLAPLPCCVMWEAARRGSRERERESVRREEAGQECSKSLNNRQEEEEDVEEVWEAERSR